MGISGEEQHEAHAPGGSDRASTLWVGRATGVVYQRALAMLSMSNDVPSAGEGQAIFVVELSGNVLAATSVDERSPLQASCTEPRIFGSVPNTALVDLMLATVDCAQQRSTRLVTTLVSLESKRIATILSRAEFQLAGEVSFYLCHPHRFPVSVESPLTLRSAVERRQALADVMHCTCEGTLDLPALLSSWSPRDMLDHLESLPGHRPELWFTVALAGKDVGTLILEADEEECRLVYLGLVPECRGRGWGHLLLAQAMQQAAKERVSRMVLSVDCNNAPAVRIYEQAGFLSYLTQKLYFRPTTAS